VCGESSREKKIERKGEKKGADQIQSILRRISLPLLSPVKSTATHPPKINSLKNNSLPFHRPLRN